MKSKGKRQKAKMIIVLLMFVSGSVYSQTYEELQDIFFYTSVKLDQARDSIEIMKSIIHKQDSVIQNDKVIIRNDSLEIRNNEAAIEMLKGEVTKVELPPMVEWKGFYPGLSIAYPFNDSVLTKQTLLDGLRYDLTAAFKFSIIGRLDIAGIVGIPLRKEKFYIKLQTDWRVF